MRENSLDKTNLDNALKEKYKNMTDSQGFLPLSVFTHKELGRQTKNIASLLDGTEGTHLGEEIRYIGNSGNYSDMKINIDDLEEFISRVKKHYGENK